MAFDPSEPPTATEAIKLVSQGRISSAQLLEYYISRVHCYEQNIWALGDVNFDGIRKKANLIDQKMAKSPLSGIPVGVKDIIDVRGLRTTCDSSIYSEYIPNKDATCVSLIKAAGGIIFGKARTTEFAYAEPTKTRNPVNQEYSPGGSSSGSAAGVAAGFFPLALGTQTGGSTIRPGSYCGVHAFKPTYDLLDKQGVKPLATSLDTIGLYGRSIADLHLLFSVLNPRKTRENFCKSGHGTSPRVALCRTPYWQRVEKDMGSLIENVASILKADEIVLPESFCQVYDDHACIMSVEAARSLQIEYELYCDQLSSKTVELIERGRQVSLSEEHIARVRLAEARSALDKLFEHYDVFITPPAPGGAPKTLTRTGDSIFNRLWTALHVPCVEVPVSRTTEGLPLGIQLVSRRYNDELLLACAMEIEMEISSSYGELDS